MCFHSSNYMKEYTCWEEMCHDLTVSKLGTFYYWLHEMLPLRTLIGRESSHLKLYHTQFSPENILSEENLQRAAKKFAQMRPVRSHANIPTKKNAAVLVPICTVNNQVSLLYTQRAVNLKTHRGQVSFPGGMQDSNDVDFVQTALRETEEELGIKKNQVDILGKGSTFVSSNLTRVQPIIGVLKNKNLMKELKVNPHEVKFVFTVPLASLCDPEHQGHTQFREGYSLPVFTGGKRRIWGLTALITHLFLSALLPKNLYSNNIKYVPPVRAAMTHHRV